VVGAFWGKQFQFRYFFRGRLFSLKNKQIILITTGVILSIFLAAVEGTVVATAMPSVVAQLGGLSIYSWVFSIYMLASTTTVPLYGKISDLFGRKKVYLFAMILFLTGSILCGLAQNMIQLIIFRAIQGLGAGGVLPMALTIIGEIFSVEKRARMQGMISGVWGVSSIVGPLIGGFLVDQISWHWVFYINLIPGSLAIFLVWFAWQDAPNPSDQKVQLDISGAVLLTLGGLSLLLGLNELGHPSGWWFMAAAIGLLTGLFFIEKRAPDPILPLHLFSDRLFLVSIFHGILAGWAMFGSLSYVPLFVQAVLGTTATVAGITLTPMSLSWTLASIYGGRLVLKFAFRAIAIFGMVLLVIGAFLMTTITAGTTWITVMIFTSFMGIGMGLTLPVYMIAVQTVVKRRDLGTATSTVQFSRSIGGTIGVSIMGAFLSTRLASLLLKAGYPSGTVDLNNLINPQPGSSALVEETIRNVLGTSMANMFWLALIPAAVALIAVFFTPKGKITQLSIQETVKQ
jgi:EmrB/QacA subfamily drug resistance transporter